MTNYGHFGPRLKSHIYLGFSRNHSTLWLWFRALYKHTYLLNYLLTLPSVVLLIVASCRRKPEKKQPLRKHSTGSSLADGRAGNTTERRFFRAIVRYLTLPFKGPFTLSAVRSAAMRIRSDTRGYVANVIVVIDFNEFDYNGRACLYVMWTALKSKKLNQNLKYTTAFYASPCFWNQLLVFLCQPHSSTSFSISDSPIPSPITSSIDSPLCSSLTPSLFHSQLKTYLFSQILPSYFHSPRLSPGRFFLSYPVFICIKKYISPFLWLELD